MNKSIKKQIKSREKKRNKITKVILLTIMWLIVWSLAAFILAPSLIMVVLLPQVVDGTITTTQANNSVLTVIIILGVIFVGVVWLMRKVKSLSYRISRYVLLVCTIVGLIFGIPMSLLGFWVPEYNDSSTGNIKDNNSIQITAKRWQYMLCSDGSARYFTDEQFKNPQAGFTEEGEDYCALSGNGTMTKLADEPPKTANQQAPNTTATPNAQYQESINKQKKNEECLSMWNSSYTTPKRQLESRLGGKPSTAHIINYIGTSQYESVVVEYNNKARQWNTSLKGYEQNYNNSVQGMGCDNVHLFTGYDFDKVNEYNY